jgi:peptide/nickel transport system permease protein
MMKQSDAHNRSKVYQTVTDSSDMRQDAVSSVEHSANWSTISASNDRKNVASGRRFAVVLRSIWKRGEGKFALIVMTLWVVISLISLFWTPQPLWKTDGYQVWAKSSATHWLGTDGIGADVFSWLMAGARTDLFIAVASVIFAGMLGILLISIMVSRNSVLSNVSVVAVDALISIPTILIALILAVPMGASAMVVVLACGIGYGLNLARIARPEALLAANSDYVESALSYGASGFSVMLHHILPNVMPTVMVQLSLSAGTAVLAESGLTYLGIGVPSDVPSWGHSLATSVKLIDVYPLSVLWPGLVVTVVVVALNIFGDVLRDATDPSSNPELRRS